MMTLALVREELVPVEQLRPGENVILPMGVRVTVERVDEYDGVFVVRWWRLAERGEPGWRTQGPDALDGRYLGSLIGVPAGHCWRVDRAG